MQNSSPSDNAAPSRDPANTDDVGGAMSFLFKKQIQQMGGLMPVSIVSHERKDGNYATVQPLISMLHTDGNTSSRPPLSRVPVLSIGGGGVTLNFHLKAGDLAWVIPAARDISGFIETLGTSAPATVRMFDWGDSWLIPDVLRRYVIPEGMEEHATFQTTDGGTFVALNKGDMVIRTDGKVLFKAPDATIEFDNAVEQFSTLRTTVENWSVTAAQMTVTNLHVNNFTADKAVINGVDYGTHYHPGLSPGAAPIN